MAIYNLLNGQLGGTNIYDEAKKAGASDTLFVLLGDQISVPSVSAQADLTWARDCSIEIIVTQKTDVSVSKDDIDDKSEQILEKIFTAYNTEAWTVPPLNQFCNPVFTSSRTTRIQISATETIIAKTLVITITIIKQF